MEAKECLLTSSVPRSLETKNKIFGFELADVILILFNLSIQNLVFGGSSIRLPMVVGTTATMAFVLFFVKRGKPDRYVEHLASYLLASTIIEANREDWDYKPFRGDE